MKRLIYAILILCMAFPAVSQPRCPNRATAQQQLNDTYREGVRVRGIASNGYLMEIWQTVNGSTFTVTVTTPQGVTCPIISGTDLESVILYVPPKDEVSG